MYEKRANSIRKVIHMLTAFIWVKMDRAAGFNLMSAGDELFDGKLFMVKENLFINFMVSKSKKKKSQKFIIFPNEENCGEKISASNAMQNVEVWWKINYVKDEDERKWPARALRGNQLD